MLFIWDSNIFSLKKIVKIYKNINLSSNFILLIFIHRKKCQKIWRNVLYGLSEPNTLLNTTIDIHVFLLNYSDDILPMHH